MELGAILGIAGTALGVAGTIVSGMADDKKMDEKVQKEVAKQMKDKEKEA